MICLTVCEVTAMCCHVLVFMFTCFWSTALVNNAHILRCPGTAFWVTAACYIVSTWANAVLYGCGALHNTGDPFIDSGLYIKSVEAHTGPGRGEYCRQGCWYKIASSFYFSMYTQNNLADCSTSVCCLRLQEVCAAVCSSLHNTIMSSECQDTPAECTECLTILCLLQGLLSVISQQSLRQQERGTSSTTMTHSWPDKRRTALTSGFMVVS